MTRCQQCHNLLDTEPGFSSNDPQLHLEEVEKEILRVNNHLGNLFEKRRALKQQVNFQLSPILRLPNEILGEISMATFPQGIHVDLWEEATPLLLGSICRTWRHTIWSMPQIWSTIRVEVQAKYRASKFLLFEEWLLRSQKLPISVHVKFPKPQDDNEAGMMWKALDLIARNSERWQEIHLDVPYFFDDGTNCYIPKSFPQLRSLSLQNRADLRIVDFDMFQSAPILSEVSLRFMNHRRIVLPAIPLSRLTLTHLGGIDILQLLSRYPNLVHLAISCLSYSNRDPQKTESISLKTLDITFDYYVNADTFTSLFNNLSTPCLLDLRIDMNRCPPFSHTILAPILSRSSLTLVRLCLFRARILDEGLVECLKVIPNLRELKLGEMTIETYLIHNLTIHEEEGSSILLPQLQSLFLALNELLFDFVDLAKMIRTRRSGAMSVRGGRVAEMESLTVHLANLKKRKGHRCKGLPGPMKLRHFRNLEKEGMKIEIKTPNQTLVPEDNTTRI